ncbi:MAG: mechanosensitive ion channel [Ignavibacteriae bacterium]|nr:mechanosensitive ion channel [Ignavibacteriota bacterium]
MEDSVKQILFDPTVGKIITALIVIIVILFLSKLVQKNITKIVKESSSKYRIRKFIDFLGFLLIVVAISIIYSDKLGGLTVAFGVAGAGIAFALQEVIISIAGWIAITFGRYYKVGDRILLGGVKGDVIDISVLRTTIMECGDWVNGDLYNGRVVRLANSFLFKDPVYNYSGDFPFLWDEIVIPIRHGVNVETVRTTFNNIAFEVVGDYAKNALVSWKEMVNKFMIENARVDPMITVTFNENWINFTIRYVVEYKSRRSTKDKMFTRILEEVNKSNGQIKIACSTLEISQDGLFNVKLNNIAE